MANNSTINEFDLHYTNDTYHLTSIKRFKRLFPVVSKKFIWNYLTNKYIIKDIYMECVWIFFITDDDTIKGFYKMNLMESHSFTGIDALRVILMADVKNVIFAMHFGDKLDISDFPPMITKFYQNRLTPLRINVLDTLIVSDKKYHSLKINSLI